MKNRISNMSFLVVVIVVFTAGTGCLMNNYKTFTYNTTRKQTANKEPVQKATVEISSEDEPDSKPEFVQAKVNNELERLLKAVKKSNEKQSAQFDDTEETSNDPDSLASKLTSNRKKNLSPAPISKVEINPVRKKNRQDDPVVQIEKPKPKPKIKIVKIAPVAVEPELQPEPVSVPEPAPISPKKYRANKSAKLNILEMESDPEGALKVLLSQLEQKIKDRPEDTATQVKLRLIHALLGQYKQALKDDSRNSGKLAGSLAELVKIFDSRDLSQAQQANQALDVVRQLQTCLQETADLQIANIKLCREVLSFGSYTVMPENYFIAGKRRPVIVYIELENFVSKYLTEKKLYQTLLSLTIEVLDTNNSSRVCWRHHDEQIEDLSMKQRRDFYIARLITLPATLPAGNLKLKITVEDIHGNKVSQKMIPLKMN